MTKEITELFREGELLVWEGVENRKMSRGQGGRVSLAEGTVCARGLEKESTGKILFGKLW